MQTLVGFYEQNMSIYQNINMCFLKWNQKRSVFHKEILKKKIILKFVKKSYFSHEN